MTDLQTILVAKFPKTEERIEGQLVFLEQNEIRRLDCPRLQSSTNLNFYIAQFFTGYRKFSIIEAVVGVSNNNDVYLLTNPIFSDKYSDLNPIFENIESANVDKGIVTEVVDLYRATGAKITDIKPNKYQIWFGDNKWRILEFEINDRLKITTTPNSTMSKAGHSWWQKLLGPK